MLGRDMAAWRGHGPGRRRSDGVRQANCTVSFELRLLLDRPKPKRRDYQLDQKPDCGRRIPFFCAEPSSSPVVEQRYLVAEEPPPAAIAGVHERTAGVVDRIRALALVVVYSRVHKAPPPSLRRTGLSLSAPCTASA